MNKIEQNKTLKSENYRIETIIRQVQAVETKVQNEIKLYNSVEKDLQLYKKWSER